MEEKFRQTWEKETWLPVPDGCHTESTTNEDEQLCAARGASQAGEPSSLWPPRSGRRRTSNAAEKVMLERAEGSLWKERVPLPSSSGCETDSVRETAGGAPSGDWPSLQAVESIFSPRREPAPRGWLRGLSSRLADNPRNDRRQPQPTDVVLSILLQKHLLRVSPAGCVCSEGMRKIAHWLWQPKDFAPGLSGHQGCRICPIAPGAAGSLERCPLCERGRVPVGLVLPPWGAGWGLLFAGAAGARTSPWGSLSQPRCSHVSFLLRVCPSRRESCGLRRAGAG